MKENLPASEARVFATFFHELPSRRWSTTEALAFFDEPVMSSASPISG